MEKPNAFKTPNGLLARMQAVRFGKILFNLQFVALAVMAASVLSFLFVAAYYIVLIFITIITLFTLLGNDTFLMLWSGGEVLVEVTEKLAYSWKFTVPIAMALSALSVACLCLDRYDKHGVRIAVSTTVFAASLIVLVVKLVSTGGV